MNFVFKALLAYEKLELPFIPEYNPPVLLIEFCKLAELALFVSNVFEILPDLNSLNDAFLCKTSSEGLYSQVMTFNFLCCKDH